MLDQSGMPHDEPSADAAENIAGSRQLLLPPELHYVDDRKAGISRRRLRGKFAYFLPSGECSGLLNPDTHLRREYSP